MARSKRLGVWLGDVRIADLEQKRFPAIRCRYSEAALEAWPLNSPVISCSLPLSEGLLDARAYCAGLLPEGQALQAMAAHANLPTFETFQLLARYGRDVAGALVLSEDEPSTARHDVEPFSDESLREAIDELEDHPLGTHEDSELSLAGIQDKLVLVKLADGWGRPLRGRPSTHILKLDDRRYAGLVEAEAHCLQLARDLGVTTIDCQIETISKIPCLIVSRFDRVSTDSGVTRVHQEDLCQALGIDPRAAQGRSKYQRAGGPRLLDAAELLEAYADDPELELDKLARAMTFTVLIGNANAHGKNLSLVHRDPTSIELAPLYDTVPTVVWPNLRTQAAMTIGPRTELSSVTRADLLAEAGTWSHPEDRAEGVITETINHAIDALDRQVLDSDSNLAQLIRGRAERLLHS